MKKHTPNMSLKSGKWGFSKAALVAIFLGCIGLVAWPSQEAHAFRFELDATLGSAHTFQIGGTPQQRPFQNFGANIEIMPNLQFFLVSVDFGVHYDFLQNAMTLRPGVRLHFGWFYLRAAVPLAFSFRQGVGSDLFDLGVLVGVGVKVRFGKWAFLAEGNVSPMFLHVNDRGVSMPAEIRLGFSYSF